MNVFVYTWSCRCVFVVLCSRVFDWVLSLQPNLSLPGTPPQQRRRSSSMHDVLFSIHNEAVTGGLTGPIIDRRIRRPRPSLGSALGSAAVGGIDNPLPYADDSQAVTPSSIDVPLIFDYHNLESNGTSHFSRWVPFYDWVDFTLFSTSTSSSYYCYAL